MTPESSRFSQQAINKIAEIAIARQLKQDVEISVNIVTTLNQLTKGQIDAIAILIRGLVLSENLRTDEFQLDIGAVTVKPFSAMKGKIKLVHPSEGRLRIVVDQNDLTIALNQLLQRSSARQSEFLQDSQNPSSVRCGFADGVVTVQHNSRNLSPNRSTDLSAGQFANSFSDTESIVLTPVASSAQGIDWRSLSSGQLGSQWISNLLDDLDRLLSLKDFEQKGLFLKVQEIQIADGKLAIDANAFIQEFPPD
ncbi:LmeA family phospholipid-binding protein [Leptolyngbya ohadii]|uniref:LmeA family phospholipid-binding protein n=1 Tax=Leptolyngbya ohadii TaxID=1962290 RepID=UPI000B599257|nr:DUF2993 domain-containing protein [Leptolyngbya ohadii]